MCQCVFPVLLFLARHVLDILFDDVGCCDFLVL